MKSLNWFKVRIHVIREKIVRIIMRTNFKYVNNMLKKKFIKHNNSKYIIFVFIVKKLKKKLWVYVNYHVFNAFTLKNHNVLSFIKNTLTYFYHAKIYNKFNIIIIFKLIASSRVLDSILNDSISILKIEKSSRI